MTIHDPSTPVLVLRSHSHGGLNIMKSLGPLGIDVYNIDPDHFSPAHYSRYCRGRFFGDIEHSPAKNSLAYLEAIHGKIGRKAILIPTTDATSQFVDQWKVILRDWFIFPDQPLGLVNALCSKKEMYHVARQHGIPTPECCFPTSRADLWEFLQTAKFPVMLKAIDGQRLWERIGKKMFIVRTPEELIQKYALAEDPACHNLILQEYIPGGDDSVWMFNGYFNHDSDELVGFTGKKIRQCPIHTGCTSLGICLRNDEVAATTRRFMKAVGYRGILDIGYRFDARDGLYKVLDINPRIGATFRLFVGTNGIDVARALYLDLTGQRVVRSTAAEGRKWIVEDLDLASSYRYFREGGMTIGNWMKSLRGIDEAAFLSLSDPLPIVFMALCRAHDVVSRVYRKVKTWVVKPQRPARAPSRLVAYPQREFSARPQARGRVGAHSNRSL
jgi:predicted ATP-grasp superfamily ATP-dependent carboligase